MEKRCEQVRQSGCEQLLLFATCWRVVCNALFRTVLSCEQPPSQRVSKRWLVGGCLQLIF
jgi:hypothetical protein